MILAYSCLACWAILIEIDFHYFAIYNVFVIARHHFCCGILSVELLHCLILIQENRVRILIEPILLFLILPLIIEALERILALIRDCIIGLGSIEI